MSNIFDRVKADSDYIVAVTGIDHEHILVGYDVDNDVIKQALVNRIDFEDVRRGHYNLVYKMLSLIGGQDCILTSLVVTSECVLLGYNHVYTRLKTLWVDGVDMLDENTNSPEEISRLVEAHANMFKYVVH